MKPEVLAIVPARGGTKGVPGKNLKQLLGKPLLSYAIEPALKSKSVQRVILSSDNDRIIETGRDLGAEIPFVRPHELALDDTPDRLVFQHALNWLKQNEGYEPDFVLNLRCTTPMKTVEDIDRVVSMWIDKETDSVRTMSPVDGVFHPYWMFRKDEQGLAHSFIEGISVHEYYQRQLLPPACRLNGLVDGIKTDIILNHSFFYGEKMGIVEVPNKRALDIDTLEDFELAEFWLSRFIK